MQSAQILKWEMEIKEQYEKYAVCLKNECCSLFLDFPVVMKNLGGVEKRLRYDLMEKSACGYTGSVRNIDEYGNEYLIIDQWNCNGDKVSVRRSVSCEKKVKRTAIRLTSEFRCRDSRAQSLDDYQFLIPGALYNKNDTDGDGQDDYLGTFSQDCKDDRNPSLSVTAYMKQSGCFVSLLRGDVPVKDTTVTREQIRKRHFVHDTDLGSLGVSPSVCHGKEVVLRCDYPFYERNSFCLNVDGSEWAAYKEIKEGELFQVDYILLTGTAENLTDASWQTTVLQMKRILDPEVKLPFTLKEAQYYRRKMVNESFREFPDKKGKPAGYFIHFSPRKKYGEQNLLEYGFCGQQTLLSLDMLEAYYETYEDEYREKALKTLNYFVENQIAESGLPNGIYNVDKEETVYWWTGILFPFQYSKDRRELEKYLGGQVVSSLMDVAGELEKVEGNYCRSMVDTMYYLLKCYILEKEKGQEHPSWLEAVEKFCDKMLEMQNENGSWNRGYSMDGTALTKPVQWFGATEEEQGSGAIFPAAVLIELYHCTGNRQYLEAAEKAAHFVYDHYVEDVKYIGGINDTTCKKSVKLDAASVMFAMRTMLMVYETTKEKCLLKGARDAGRILASWTYLWDIPFDKTTLLGKYGFKTTGWTGCDVIPASSYVDCSFQEMVPELIRIAQYYNDVDLGIIARIVTRGMQYGLSMPQNMYGYALPGVQCEGYMTSLWLADSGDLEFSGAAAKNKGDDNDTCNGFVNAMALRNIDVLMKYSNDEYLDEILFNFK